MDELWLGGRAEACESQRDYAVHGEKICLPYHGRERLRVPLTRYMIDQRNRPALFLIRSI